MTQDQPTAKLLPEYTLKIKRTQENWWVLTCEEDRGVFLANPDLNKVITQFPGAAHIKPCWGS